MANLVLERINAQIKKPEIIQETREPLPEIPKPTLIEPEDLRKMLMDEITEKTPEPTPEKTMNFDGLEAFVSWYFNVKDGFSQGQQIALSTLVQARNLIYQGCKCKEKDRRVQANAYFKSFWENNRTTDLPLKVLEVGQFNSISFLVDQLEFLKISLPTP